MRVVRRDALPALYPLPDGLHFTPAMSARVLLSNDLSLREIDMPYSERAGESKLRPGKDGLRFLQVIVKTAVLFRPSRVLGLVSIPLFVAAIALLAAPVFDWASDGTWPEGTRGAEAAAGAVLMIAGVLLLSTGYVAGRVVAVVLKVESGGRMFRVARSVIGADWFWAIPIGLALAGLAAGIAGALVDGDARGLFTMVVLGSLAVLSAVTRLLDRFIEIVAERLRYEEEEAPFVLSAR
jgi:hypothetical protein